MGFKGNSIVLISLLFCQISANGQNYSAGDNYHLGMKAGPALSLLLGDGFTTPSVLYGFTGGLYYKRQLKNGFHFQTEISSTIRGAKFDNSGQFGYDKVSLLFIDAAQLILKDLNKGSHTHCAVFGIQPSLIAQSWVYNSYYQLSPAARDIQLNTLDVFAVVGYQLNRKIIGIQSVFKLGLTNINRGLNMYDDGGNQLGPTNNNGKIFNLSWETCLSF